MACKIYLALGRASSSCAAILNILRFKGTYKEKKKDENVKFNTSYITREWVSEAGKAVNGWAYMLVGSEYHIWERRMRCQSVVTTVAILDWLG